MPDKQVDSQDQQAIEQRALELVEVSVFQPSAKASQAVEHFAQTSFSHQQAVEKAKRFVQISRHAKRSQKGLRYRLGYSLELEWHRFLKTLTSPTLLPILTGTASILCVWLLMMDGGESNIRPALPQQAAVKAEYQTRWRETKNVKLNDGSILWLGSDSLASVTFTSQQRLVKLQKGQAGFKVIQDSMRPFIVSAGAVTTKVTGTEFTVNMFDRESVEVAVVEGQVEVAVAKQINQILNAEQVVRANDLSLTEVSYRSQQSIGSWRKGTFVFEQRALLEVLQELAPYSQYQLDISWLEQTLLLSPVSGVFFTDQADDALFTVLQSKDLTVEHVGGNQLLVKRALRPYSL